MVQPFGVPMSLNEDKAIWLPIFPETMVKVCNLNRSEMLFATQARNPGFAGMARSGPGSEPQFQ
jgi:hypothetical protein